MRLAELDYTLPAELIAQVPVEPRDASRLLVAGGSAARLRLDDRRFAELPGLLRAGDVLVRNDTRVIPARAHFRKPTGGRVELLFLERLAAPADDRPAPGDTGLRAACDESGESWQVLARGRLRGGETLRSEAAPESFAVEVGEALGDGRWQVRLVAGAAEPVAGLLARYGETPLAALHPDGAGRPRALPDGLRPAAGVRRGADRRAALHPGARRGAGRRRGSPSSTSRCTSAWRPSSR